MKQSFLFMFLMALVVGTKAQSIGPSTLNAAGGSASISGNTYEWSVGEMTVVSTFTSGSLVVTQGVLQPVLATTGIGNASFLTQNMQVFPNPTENILYLQPSFTKGGVLRCVLQDVAGKTISQSEWTLANGKEQQSLNLTQLATGHYMMQLSFTQDGQQFTAPYKIQKLN